MLAAVRGVIRGIERDEKAASGVVGRDGMGEETDGGVEGRSLLWLTSTWPKVSCGCGADAGGTPEIDEGHMLSWCWHKKEMEW